MLFFVLLSRPLLLLWLLLLLLSLQLTASGVCFVLLLLLLFRSQCVTKCMCLLHSQSFGSFIFPSCSLYVCYSRPLVDWCWCLCFAIDVRFGIAYVQTICFRLYVNGLEKQRKVGSQLSYLYYFVIPTRERIGLTRVFGFLPQFLLWCYTQQEYFRDIEKQTTTYKKNYLNKK